MKNFKRLAIAAVVAVMAFGVTAFASTTASYNDGAIKLNSTAFMTAGTEYTVVLTAKDAAITDENILYINQGTKDEDFWLDGMGPKTILDEAGEYTLTIASVGGIEEVITIGATVEENGSVVLDETPIALDGDKIIKYAILTVTKANETSTLSISDGTTTKTYNQTLAQILGGEWVTGSNVSATLAVGVSTTDATKEFTVTVVPAN